MYSGVYPSSVKALHKVYDWSMNQASTPLYLSDFARRAKSLYETGLAKPLNNDADWLIVSTGIKSLRLSDAFKELSLAHSNIAGWNTGPDGRYLILTDTRSLLKFQNAVENLPYLKQVNGIVEKWQLKGNTIHFQIKSHVAMSMELENGSECRLLKSNVKLIKSLSRTGALSYTYSKPGIYIGELECKYASR